LKEISRERRERKVYSVALRDDVRTWVLIQGKSQRAAARYFGLSRNTVAKLLEEEPAPKERRYQRQAEQKTPVRDAALPHIEKWLKENEWLSRLRTKTVLDSASDVGRIA
jgi:transposase